MNDETFLTTYDNPFNPFDDFETWWKYDYFTLKHDCCGLLARTANTSEVYSDEVNSKLIDEAMQKIVEDEPLIYKIATPKDYKQGV